MVYCNPPCFRNCSCVFYFYATIIKECRGMRTIIENNQTWYITNDHELEQLKWRKESNGMEHSL